MSANGLTGENSSPVAGFFAAGSRDVFAGLVGGVVSIAYGLSFAALIFAGPLRPWLAYGIAATFLTMAVSAAIIAARSSIPFAIGGPDAATSAVTATLVASAIQRVGTEELATDLLTPVMIGAALAAALTQIFRSGLLSHDIMLAPDLDRALEACEEAVISAHSCERSETSGLRERSLPPREAL